MREKPFRLGSAGALDLGEVRDYLLMHRRFEGHGGRKSRARVPTFWQTNDSNNYRAFAMEKRAVAFGGSENAAVLKMRLASERSVFMFRLFFHKPKKT